MWQSLGWDVREQRESFSSVRLQPRVVKFFSKFHNSGSYKASYLSLTNFILNLIIVNSSTLESRDTTAYVKVLALLTNANYE